MKCKINNILEKIEFDILPVMCAIYLPFGFLLLAYAVTGTGPISLEDTCFILGVTISILWASPRALLLI